MHYVEDSRLSLLNIGTAKDPRTSRMARAVKGRTNSFGMFSTQTDMVSMAAMITSTIIVDINVTHIIVVALEARSNNPVWLLAKAMTPKVTMSLVRRSLSNVPSLQIAAAVKKKAITEIPIPKPDSM